VTKLSHATNYANIKIRRNIRATIDHNSSDSQHETDSVPAPDTAPDGGEQTGSNNPQSLSLSSSSSRESRRPELVMFGDPTARRVSASSPTPDDHLNSTDRRQSASCSVDSRLLTADDWTTPVHNSRYFWALSTSDHHTLRRYGLHTFL